MRNWEIVYGFYGELFQDKTVEIKANTRFEAIDKLFEMLPTEKQDNLYLINLQEKGQK